MTFPEFNPILVQLGPFAVRWYALAYVAGIILGWLYCRALVGDRRLWRGARPTLTVTQVDDFVAWVALGIILGGRIGYVLFYMLPQQPAALARDPLSVLRLWEGGMSFHGGLLGVILAIVLFAWRNKVDLVRLGDLTAPCVPFGLFFGRVANFVNGELWGRPTDGPWGVVFCNSAIRKTYGGCPAGLSPRHPSQLYEATLEGLVLFLALRWATHGGKLLPRRGFVSGAFLLLYGLFRLALEQVREPDAGMPALPLGLSMGMALSLPMVLAGAALIALSLRPGALAAPEPDLELADASTAHPPEAASDPFPAYESEAAEPFAPVRPDEPARPA